MKHSSKTWFSIALAMWVILLLSLTGLYLVEYMIPFSRSVKWIENASQAFYESYAGVEESIFSVYDGNLGNNHSRFHSDDQDYEYNFLWSWDEIPAPWEWNVSNNLDYSRFSQNEPINLEVWNARFNNAGETIDLFLQIPNGVDFDAPYTDEIILLQLSWAGWSLTSASGALLRESDVRSTSAIDILSENGTTLTGVNRTFRQYFSDLWCSDASTQCVLRASIIRPLISDSWDALIPYLEYRLETSKPIPYPNPLVTSQGKSFWFSKTLEVFIPQEATSSAFDFTVLQ